MIRKSKNPFIRFLIKSPISIHIHFKKSKKYIICLQWYVSCIIWKEIFCAYIQIKLFLFRYSLQKCLINQKWMNYIHFYWNFVFIFVANEFILLCTLIEQISLLKIFLILNWNHFFIQIEISIVQNFTRNRISRKSRALITHFANNFLAKSLSELLLNCGINIINVIISYRHIYLTTWLRFFVRIWANNLAKVPVLVLPRMVRLLPNLFHFFFICLIYLIYQIYLWAFLAFLLLKSDAVLLSNASQTFLVF